MNCEICLDGSCQSCLTYKVAMDSYKAQEEAEEKKRKKRVVLCSDCLVKALAKMNPR